MAAKSAAERREEQRIARERALRARRALYLLAGMTFLSFSVLAVVGKGGVLDVRRIEGERKQLERELRQLERQNRRQLRRIEALESDPAAMERLARETLDYQGRDEIVYYLPE